MFQVGSDETQAISGYLRVLAEPRWSKREPLMVNLSFSTGSKESVEEHRKEEVELGDKVTIFAGFNKPEIALKMVSDRNLSTC